MKVAKLLLAAAIAAPSLFLTSCEKQVDVQADTISRSNTNALARPVARTFMIIPSVDESGWNLSFFVSGEACGTGTFQEFVNGKWVDVSAPQSFADGYGFVTLNRTESPVSGSQFRIFYIPTKGQGGCQSNYQRGASSEVYIEP